MSTVVEDLRGYIVRAVSDVLGIGVVHNRERYAEDWDDYLALFAVPGAAAGRQQIRGAQVIYRGWPEAERSSTNEDIRTHEFVVTFILSFNDAAESEIEASLIAERIGEALDDDTILDDVDNILDTEPAVLEIFEIRFAGSVMVHWAEVSVRCLQEST